MKNLESEYIAQVRAEYTRLGRILELLDAKTPAKAQTPVLGKRTAKKSPPGALQDAIVAALKGSKPLGNAQLRLSLAGSNYPYSLVPGHVSKTLMEMVHARKIKRVGTGTASKYLTK